MKLIKTKNVTFISITPSQHVMVNIQGRVVQSPIKVTQSQRQFRFQFCNFSVSCSVYSVCPSVLSCSNLKLHQTLDGENIFIQENMMLQLLFNPGLTLTGFRKTWPRSTFSWAQGLLFDMRIISVSCVLLLFIVAFFQIVLQSPLCDQGQSPMMGRVVESIVMKGCNAVIFY